MKLISVEDELPPFGKQVLVRTYRDTWLDGVEWVEACREEAHPFDGETAEWVWEETGFDEYSPDEVDYWFEIPLVGDEADHVSTD